MCRGIINLDIVPFYKDDFDVPPLPNLHGWNTIYDFPFIPRQELSWPSILCPNSQRYCACSSCYYPIAPEEQVIFDPNIGIICPVESLTCLDLLGHYNNIDMAHWQRFVSCENCDEILSYNGNIPDVALNYENTNRMAILQHGNVIFGMTEDIYVDLQTMNSQGRDVIYVEISSDSDSDSD